MTAILDLENVKKSYLEPNGHILPILNIPRFTLARAEQMALVGPSGCGKTTLLQVITGISRADAGIIRLDGVDIASLSEAGRDRVRAAKLGYVFQTFNLLPGFTALENVLLGMTFARGRRDGRLARELLERVGLGHRAHHKPQALSVGEQQRVAVARALANRPALVLADEPTANVDRANQGKIVELMCGTCREFGTALIMVTHTPEVAGKFDRVDAFDQINLVGEDV